MALRAPAPARYSNETYFDLVTQGVLGPDDRVELLGGVIVAVAPSNPRHESATTRVYRRLLAALGPDVVIRVQMSLVAGADSVPEPDVAVVPGVVGDYDAQRPASALLVVEVADSSLPQDRLTKTRIYAAAGVPQYVIVNLRDGILESHESPDRDASAYRVRRVGGRGESIPLVAFPGASLVVDDVLPHA